MAGLRERESLMERIEEICLKVVQQIMSGQLPELNMSRKRDWTTVNTPTETTANTPTVSTVNTPTVKEKSYTKDTAIRFSSRRSVVKFGAMMKVLSSVHLLILQDKYCTKRDLYYQDPELYGNQRYVDQLIDSLSAMLKVPRWHLHVVATSKGVIAGDLTFLDADGKMVDCSASKNGILLPALIHKIELIRTKARFVIIVEKDATFQHLLEDKVFNVLGPCIIITAKGYPDLNTRMLLKMISVKFCHIPQLALVDADPHGVAIYLTYKFGSIVHAHDVENLAIPSLVWLGVLPSDIDDLQLPDHTALDLTTKERAQVQDIMNRGYMKDLHRELAELHIMLTKNKKIEIQSLDAFNRSYLLNVYLPYRLGKLGYSIQSTWE